MGIEWHTARFLIGAYKDGVQFASTATLGRQELFVAQHTLAELFCEFGITPSIPLSDALKENLAYADGFFALLGSKTFVPIDYSPYEGAAEVHDMNFPIPDRLRCSFDLVVDGGTLEHVFNFPTAIKNAMEMVRVGGHLLIQSPANNYYGHGFYQFSPELYFRVLSPENGFLVERMVTCEAYDASQWYEVTDPSQRGARVELISRQRVILLIRARRTHEAPVFATTPQQSDYVEAWSGEGRQTAGTNSSTYVRTKPTVIQRLMWKALRLSGIEDGQSILERRNWLLNQTLGINVQPDAFRPVDR